MLCLRAGSAVSVAQGVCTPSDLRATRHPAPAPTHDFRPAVALYTVNVVLWCHGSVRTVAGFTGLPTHIARVPHLRSATSTSKRSGAEGPPADVVFDAHVSGTETAYEDTGRSKGKHVVRVQAIPCSHARSVRPFGRRR